MVLHNNFSNFSKVRFCVLLKVVLGLGCEGLKAPRRDKAQSHVPSLECGVCQVPSLHFSPVADLCGRAVLTRQDRAKETPRS